MWCLRCSCGNCRIMPSAAECACCHEMSPIDAKRYEGVHPAPRCITLHPGFQSVCLDPWELQCAYYHYRQEFGPIQCNFSIGIRVLTLLYCTNMKPTPFRTYRYIAYRQLVRLCWGWLSARVRVVYPACAVTKIRDTYPSEQYTGYKYPPLD
ncbi:uncharacterized protein LOC144925944 [Branchiostoma floridae x Branchiostoma belcheri]